MAIAKDLIAIRDLPENFLSAPPPEKAEPLKALLNHMEISAGEIRVYWQEPYSYLMREDLLELAAVPSGVAAAGTPDGTAPALRAASTTKDGSLRDTGATGAAGKLAEAGGPGGEAAAREENRPGKVRTVHRSQSGSDEIESQPGMARIGELSMAEQAKGNTGSVNPFGPVEAAKWHYRVYLLGKHT